MAVTLRGYFTADSGTATGTTLTTAFTGWQTANPQPGDLVAFTGYIGADAQFPTQTGGAGTWTFYSIGEHNTSHFTSFIAWRVLLVTDTAPVFSWGSAADWALFMCAFIPSPGFTLTLDTGGVNQYTTAALSFGPPAVAATGTGELSLVLNAAQASATIGATADIAQTPPAGWAAIAEDGLGSPAATVADSVGGSWKTGVSGTVTPASEALALNVTTTVYANVYHLLFQETPAGLRGYSGAAGTPVSSIALSYTGWTPVNPQTGDVLFIVATLNVAGLTVYQSGGAGAWSVISDATNSGGSFTSFAAWRLLGAADTPPVFSWAGGAAEFAYLMFGFAPVAGKSLVPDAVVLHQFTTAANAFTPDPAVAAGTGELSVILNAAQTSSIGVNSITQTPPAGWTAVAAADAGGGASDFDYYASASWQGAVAGTVTPGSEALASAVTVYADVLHLLLRDVTTTFPVYAENVDPMEPMPGWFPGAPGMPIGVPFQRQPLTVNIERLLTVAGPNYGSAAADLGGGSGSWVNPGNADGAPDAAYATWTIP